MSHRTEPTIEEVRRMLRAPYRQGHAAKGYSGLTIGQPIGFRPYPNDPHYVEIRDDVRGVVFTETWDTVEGFDRTGKELS